MNKPFTPNIKHFKKHRRRQNRCNFVNDLVMFRKYGIIATTCGRMFDYHFETIRKLINNYFKRAANIVVRAYPCRSYTSKPHDIRRGRGKGSVDKWYYYVRINKIIMEFDSPNEQEAKNVVRIVNSRLPVKVKLSEKQL